MAGKIRGETTGGGNERYGRVVTVRPRWNVVSFTSINISNPPPFLFSFLQACGGSALSLYRAGSKKHRDGALTERQVRFTEQSVFRRSTSVRRGPNLPSVRIRFTAPFCGDHRERDLRGIRGWALLLHEKQLTTQARPGAALLLHRLAFPPSRVSVTGYVVQVYSDWKLVIRRELGCLLGHSAGNIRG